MKLTNAGSSNNGYTLIEVLISLFLLMAVAVPAISAFFLNSSSIRSQKDLTAVWLLEQEAENLRIVPGDAVSIKRRKVGDVEWVIQIEATGSPLIRYHLTALIKGKRAGELYSYSFKKSAGGH
jgi:competence protein ComGF